MNNDTIKRIAKQIDEWKRTVGGLMPLLADELLEELKRERARRVELERKQAEANNMPYRCMVCGKDEFDTRGFCVKGCTYK